MGRPARKKPTSIIVTLKGKHRPLKGVKVVGSVTVKKLQSVRGRHTQIEITGIEIDGFGEREQNLLDSRPPE